MSGSESTKQPFYKKAWFWIVVVLIVVAVGGAGASKEKDAKKVGESGSSSTSSSTSSATDDAPQTFKVGDVIAIDGVEVTVKSAERNWTAQYNKPKDGKEYVKVTVQIENKSDKTQSYNVFDWKMEDGDGAMESTALATDDDNLSSGELAKGGKKTGSIIFEVPKGDMKLKAHYTPSFFSTREAVIEL